MDTPLTELEFFYLGFARASSTTRREPARHKLPVSRITGIDIELPVPGPHSKAARAVEGLSLVSFHGADRWTMTLSFDSAASGNRANLGPDLPLVLKW